MLNSGWFRTNGFILGLVAAVILAILLPGPGAQGGILHAGILTNAGIALILLLQGLSLPLEKIKSGARIWRLHLLIQLYTFGVFPLAGLLMNSLVPLAWPEEPQAIRDGFLFLCVLPSTISTSVVLTAAARGNTVGALFNAALSNLLGIFITPALVHLLMQKTGQTTPFGPLLLKITLLTFLPFFAGMFLRPPLLARIEAHKKWIPRISNGIILFIVYSAFCDSMVERVWQRHGLSMTVHVLFYVVLLFTGMSLLIGWNCRVFKLDFADRVAAYFCAVKKNACYGCPLGDSDLRQPARSISDIAADHVLSSAAVASERIFS